MVLTLRTGRFNVILEMNFDLFFLALIPLTVTLLAMALRMIPLTVMPKVTTVQTILKMETALKTTIADLITASTMEATPTPVLMMA